MKLRITSDWHLNSYAHHYRGVFETDEEMSKAWQDKFLPVMADDAEQTLIVAGDIGHGLNSHFVSRVLSDLQQRFHNIIFVYGNHDFYSQDLLKDGETLILPRGIQGTQFSLRGYDDAVDIHATTLWTDFDGGQPQVMNLISRGLSDYRYIRGQSGFINPKEIYDAHNDQLDWLMNRTTDTKLDQRRSVIVTHHAPSAKSVSPGYAGDPYNPGFVSNLDDFVAASGAILWVHGHVHSNHDYMIGDTRVVCNPVGYTGSSNGDFENDGGYNPTFVIEL